VVASVSAGKLATTTNRHNPNATMYLLPMIPANLKNSRTIPRAAQEDLKKMIDISQTVKKSVNKSLSLRTKVITLKTSRQLASTRREFGRHDVH
jgi:hypothetical protein